MIQFLLLLAVGLAACEGLTNEYLPANQEFTKAAPGKMTKLFNRYSPQPSPDQASQLDNDPPADEVSYETVAQLAPKAKQVSLQYTASKDGFQPRGDHLCNSPPEILQRAYNRISHDEGHDSPRSILGNVRINSPGYSDPSSSGYSAGVSEYGVVPSVRDEASVTDDYQSPGSQKSSADSQFLPSSGEIFAPKAQFDASQQPSASPEIKSRAPFGQDQFGASFIAQYNKPSSPQRQFLPHGPAQFGVAPVTFQGSFGIPSTSQFPAQDATQFQYGTVQDSHGGYKY